MCVCAWEDTTETAELKPSCTVCDTFVIVFSSLGGEIL